MRDEQFDIPVSVQLPGGNRRETVDRTSQAVSLLAERWPAQGRGVKYREAVRICGEALKRQKTAAVARKAFADAAREANVLVLDRKPPAFGRKLS